MYFLQRFPLFAELCSCITLVTARFAAAIALGGIESAGQATLQVWQNAFLRSRQMLEVVFIHLPSNPGFIHVATGVAREIYSSVIFWYGSNFRGFNSRTAVGDGK